jgi:2-acylglycerol O-acyltransferase 2
MNSSETIVTETIEKSTIQKQQQQKQQHHSVRWAPLHIPIQRRLQMLAVCTWISLIFLCTTAFIVFATYKVLWPLLIAYVTFIYTDKAPEAGGRRFESARHWKVWKYFAGYFPVKLVKVCYQDVYCISY